MAEKDIESKKLEDYHDVFADIFNVLLFKKDLIDPNLLMNGPTETIYKNDGNTSKQQFRDTLKYYQNFYRFIIASLGIENQATIQRLIPIRIFGYDASSYKSQTDNLRPEDTRTRIYPTISIVLNLSMKRWNKPTNLKGILTIPDGFDDFVQDYNVHVFDIAFLPEKEINKFKSDFGVVARFMRKKRLGKDISDTTEIKHVNAVLEFLSVFTEDGRYEDVAPFVVEQKEKGKVANMCTVAEGIELKGKKKGVEEGNLEMLFGLFKKGKLTIEEVAEELNVTADKVPGIMEEFYETHPQN